jgi:predicted DNA-binding WGR domain protein
MTRLYLTLHRRWFDEIAAGTKKEEYREMTPHWQRRIVGRQYDEIHFRNGHRQDSPFMRVEYLGWTRSVQDGKPVFALQLGKVLEIRNYGVWTWLERIDPDENANRRYAVGVQPALFDPVAVIRFWGSRQTSYQQVMVQAFNDVSEARDAADKVIRREVRKGYRIVGGYVPPSLDAQPADGKG